ncbi:5'-3' exoribonuclease 3 [Vitis vinifera]|uniref:5'-3' exoribonuclease 3 n=1 Tax=Vitis vinifera TaxID=29760 RepID=UPI0028832264|nr:5'-3' exoribonuclease 3 [Vitis vinifera]
MGVPSFYRWLVNKYPEIVVRAVEDERESSSANPNGIEFDNLYLDMNGIIHPCFHPEDQIFPPTTFEEVFNNMYEYIDRIFSIVRPRKLLYMAIDGVAPRAKMNQQRRRRFQTAKDNEIAEAEEQRLRRQFEMEGKPLVPKQESQVSDPNIITPGTVFMHEVSKALQQYICSRMKHEAGWKDLKVILSDSNVPGEGEHKIMSFIRLQRSLPDYNPNTLHCLYGLDADLIMLALATHEVHFSILREDVLTLEQRGSCESAVETKTSPPKANSSLFLHVWILREYLELDMKISDPPEKLKEINFERIGAIDLLMTVYKKEFKNIGGYMVDMERIEEKKGSFVKLKRVEKFILLVGTYEEKIFKKRMALRDSKLRWLLCENSDIFTNNEEDQSCNLEIGSTNRGCTSPSGKARSSSSVENLGTSSGTEYLITDKSEMFALLFLKHSSARSLDLLLVNATLATFYTKEMKKRLKENIRAKSDLWRSGSLGIDRVRLGHPGWKERYYKEKCSCDTSQGIESTRKELVQKYTEGLLWVLQYYFSGVPSWTWFYPYHYGPFASDFKGLSRVKGKFERGSPFKPFDQLMGVLPPSSAHALPKAYQPLMIDEDSNIIDFYNTNFEVDTDGKRFIWQGICKLPFIDEARLLAETRKLEKELEDQEAVRNARSFDQLFLRFSDKLRLFYTEQVSCRKPNKTAKIDSNFSLGINGYICFDNNGLNMMNSTCLDKNLENIQEDDVISMLYEVPNGCLHIPRPLEGTIFPFKTITEADIEETLLWHEYKGSKPPVKFRGHEGFGPAINRLKSKACGSSTISAASGLNVARAGSSTRSEDHNPLILRCSGNFRSETHNQMNRVVGSRAQLQGIQDLKISENRHGLASYGRDHQSTNNFCPSKHPSTYNKSVAFDHASTRWQRGSIEHTNITWKDSLHTTTGNGQGSDRWQKGSTNVTDPPCRHISYAAAVTSMKPPARDKSFPNRW